jgi:hypothetical protein
LFGDNPHQGRPTLTPRQANASRHSTPIDPTSASVIAIPTAAAIDGSADITLAEIRFQVTPAGTTSPDDPVAVADRYCRVDGRGANVPLWVSVNVSPASARSIWAKLVEPPQHVRFVAVQSGGEQYSPR